MTKIRMAAPEPAESRRAIRPWLFNLAVAALVAYVVWLFYATPGLAGALLQALRNSVGL